MNSVESCSPYVMIGCIFYGFGLKWSYEYAKYWITLRPREDGETIKNQGFVEKCNRFLSYHPIEGSLKLVATAFGLVGTLAGGLPNYGIISPKVVHATIYLFFAFSGLVDVLNFYFPQNISDGLVKLALAQSFFVEGFLFIWTSTVKTTIINVILALIVWTTVLGVVLELVWPEAKLLRASTTLLHGAWIAHMVRVYRSDTIQPEVVALTFTWHIAAAFAVTLCIVAITRSRAPRIIIQEPPEIPIYDYCQEADQRM